MTIHAHTNQATLDAISGTAATVGAGTSQCRLTLESGVPVSATDQTAKTRVYLTPYNGDKLSLYDGASWVDRTLAEIYIDTTNTQSTTANGTTTLTVTDSSQLIVGMVVASTEVTSGQTIASITNSTTLVLSAAADGSGTSSTTFKIPASKVVDVFAYDNAGTAKLVFGPLWTDGTTRATALDDLNGAMVLDGTYAIAGTNYTEGKLKHVGTACTTATAGQVEFSESFKGIWSRYQQVDLYSRGYNTDSSWSTGGAVAIREFQNGTNQVRAKFVLGDVTYIYSEMNLIAVDGTNGKYLAGRIGIDSTTPSGAKGNTCYTAYDSDLTFTAAQSGPAIYGTILASGYHYGTQCELSSGAMTNGPDTGNLSSLYVLYRG